MNDFDRERPAPPPTRPDRNVAAMAAGIIVSSFLYITLVVAPSSQARVEATSEPPPETFTAITAFAGRSSASTSSPALAPSTAPSSPSLVVDANRVATRVSVPGLRIDLPVVPPPKDPRAYPKCNVAMYLAELHQPGEGGATYLYAHARAGMFLPIYERAIQRLHGGPRSMLGLSVEVFTSDDLRYRYAIEEVRVHQTSLGEAARAMTPELWLQTSEGPKGTRGKTQVRAVLVDVEVATHRLAHPVAKPVTCG